MAVKAALPQPFANELMIQTLFFTRGPLTESIPFDKREMEGVAETVARAAGTLRWIKQQNAPTTSLADRAKLIKNISEHVKIMLMVKNFDAIAYEAALLATKPEESLWMPKDLREKYLQAARRNEAQFREKIGETTYEDDDVTIVITPLEKIQGEVALLRKWQEKPEELVSMALNK